MAKDVEKPRPLLYQTLKVLFRYPIVVLLLGGWRMGKTDVALLVAHLAKKWGLIDKIGSNIWTFNNPDVDYIITSWKLKQWLHSDRLAKLYLFDEALTHIPRRTAMSHTNISMLKLLAEISKGHGRMIVISQVDLLDSGILNPEFCRAKWKKTSRKVMVCKSKHHPTRTFRNLPKSPIRFDPDRLAPFIDKEMSKTESKEGNEIYNVARLYSRNLSMNEISNELNLHAEKVKRDIRKALDWFCKHQYEFPKDKIDYNSEK